MIDRYALPEIAGLFTDEARFRAWLEVEILATEAWAEARRGPRRRRRGGPGTGRLRPSPRSTSGSASPSTTSPPSSTSCRSASAPPAGSWVHYGLTSSDVVDTALSVVAGAGRATSLLEAAAALEAAITAQAHAYRDDADGRAHPRHPRRAHHVRRQARALGDAGAPRPRAAASGPARAIAVGKLSGAVGTYSNIDPAVEAYVCEALGLTPGARHPGDRPRPPRRAALRVRVGRRDHRGVRHRDPPPPAHRGARGRGAVPRRVAEGLERDAAQAQPGEGRAAQRSGPRAARQPAGRPGERRAVARARHLALVGRAHHPPRLAAARVLRAGEVPQHRRGHARLPRADAARTSTRRTGSCSASRCCSRWSSRA